jgi:hypothetical protein
MFWELVTIIPVWSCYELLSIATFAHWHPSLIFSAAVPVGFVTSTWLHFFGQLYTPLGVTLSCLILGLYVVVGTAAHFLHRRWIWLHLPDTSYLVIGCCCLVFLVGCHSSFLQSGLCSQGTTYSDLPFHMNLITSFAYGVNSNRSSFWPFQTTFYAFETLIYPIIPDYHATVLVSVGASVRMSLFIPSFMLSVSLVCALWHLGRQFSTERFVAEATVVLFCFAGGDGWKRLFRDYSSADPSVLLNTNYAHNFGDHETFWIHPVIHFLFPQRSAMFSMPLVIVATIAFVQCIAGGYQSKLLMFVAGLSISLIPMTSGHSFLAVCILAGFFAAGSFPLKNPGRWMNFFVHWLLFSVPIVVVGLPQSLAYVRRAWLGEFVRAEVIWKEYGKATLGTCLWMWWESLSVFLVLSIFHCWFALERRQIAIYGPAFGVFILANILRFQPGAMDNTKIFIAAWYPLACCAVGQFFARLHTRTPPLAAALAIGATASGILCIVKSLSVPFPIFLPQDLEVGLWAIENTPLESVFLTTEYPGMAVTAIAGRTALMTFPGWAWTHGIYNVYRTALVAEMWKTANAQLFRERGTRYALSMLGRQKERFNVNEPDPGWITVFKLKGVEVWEVVDELL